MTTPPKRVAMPPASTSEATWPARSASTPVLDTSANAASPGAGRLGQIARLGRLDLSCDDIARRSEGPGRDELAQPLEPRRVEPAAFEQRACRWVDLVEDHDARTGIGNDDP